MNKKAQLGDQISIIYFIILIVIVVLGLVWGTFSFFGGGYDVRSLQAQWLGNVVENCLQNNAIDLQDREEFFSLCNLNEKSLTEHGFLIRVCEDDCYHNGNVLFSVNSNYQSCGFTKTTSTNSLQCSDKQINFDGKEVHLLVGSKINPRRIK